METNRAQMSIEEDKSITADISAVYWVGGDRYFSQKNFWRPKSRLAAEWTEEESDKLEQWEGEEESGDIEGSVWRIQKRQWWPALSLGHSYVLASIQNNLSCSEFKEQINKAKYVSWTSWLMRAWMSSMLLKWFPGYMSDEREIF